MRKELLDILSEGNGEMDPQKLLRYFEGKLDAREQQEVEAWMQEHPLFMEAIEGLEQEADKVRIQTTLYKLNRQMKEFLKKQKRSRRPMPVSRWTIAAVIIVLLLIFLFYLVMRLI